MIKAILVATVVEVVLILALVCTLYVAVSRADMRHGPRTYSTPQGITCDTVRSYYAMLGGMEGVKAYGRQNNVTLTPQQQRAALACLRKSDRGLVTTAELHRAMDQALKNGWQPPQEEP